MPDRDLLLQGLSSQRLEGGTPGLLNTQATSIPTVTVTYSDCKQQQQVPMHKLVQQLRKTNRQAKPPNGDSSDYLPILCFVCQEDEGPILPQNVGVLLNAGKALDTGGPWSNTKRGNYKGEYLYRELYDEMCQNQETLETWLSLVRIPGNITCVTQRILGCLITLAEIYQRRGVVEDCKSVLNLVNTVLECAKESSERECANRQDDTKDIYSFCHYRMLCVLYWVVLEEHQWDEVVDLFRVIRAMEFSESLHPGREFMSVMGTGLSPRSINLSSSITSVLRLASTMATLESLTDMQVKQCAEATLCPERIRMQRQAVALKTCANCGKSEPALDMFRLCSQCQATHYCSEACQRENWKIHKKTCQKAK